MPTKITQQRDNVESHLREYFTRLYADWLSDIGSEGVSSDAKIAAFAMEMDGAAGLSEAQIKRLIQF